MNLYNKLIRLFCAIVCISFFIPTTFAQSSKTSYFMKTVPNRNTLNPALMPENNYMGIPLLSNIQAGVQTNSLNMDNLTYKINTGERATFMHSGVDADKFLSNLSDKNYLFADVNYNLFSMGKFQYGGFWNIDFGVRATADANIPKSFFNFAKRGLDLADGEVSQHDIYNTSATAHSYVELGLSYARNFLDNSLTLGARGKLLGGLGNADLNAKSMHIVATQDEWRVKSRVELHGSAPGVSPKYDDDDMLDGFDFGNFTVSGYGLGFDIGGVYDFRELSKTLVGTPADILSNLKVSLAFTDIGFISWSKNNSVLMRSDEKEVVITPNDYTIYTDGTSSLEDIFDDILDDLEQSVNLKEYKSSGRSTSLRTTMVLGLEYEILPSMLTAGFLYTNRFGNYFNLSEYTLSANYRANSWVSTSLSYSFAHSAFNTFGWAIHLAPSKGVNFFLASDYIIPHISPQALPTTSKALNVQLGFSVPL